MLFFNIEEIDLDIVDILIMVETGELTVIEAKREIEQRFELTDRAELENDSDDLIKSIQFKDGRPITHQDNTDSSESIEDFLKKLGIF